MRSPLWLAICWGLVHSIGLTSIFGADDLRIPRLIEQLGAPEYTTRERSQSELADLGLEAFEALFEAQHSKDLEIATRARYLIRGMNVRWYQDSDPVEVKRLLRGYGDATVDERKGLIDKLLSMDEPGVLPVLCRLVRYESDLVLSKYAAVRLLEQELPVAAADRRERAATIRTSTIAGKRASTEWLRCYALSLEDAEAALPKWETLISQELETRNTQPEQSKQSSSRICRDLLRFQVSQLAIFERQAEIDRAIERVISLAGDSRDEVADLVGWLVSQQAWEKILGLQAKHAEFFAEHPPLLYRLAQAQRELQQDELARKSAAAALELHPEAFDEHLVTAEMLKDSGLFDWAQKEFELVCNTAPVGSGYDIRARFLLSEMLHDQAQDLAASTTLKAVIDLIEKDNQAAEWAAKLRGEVGAVYARMHYFAALHYLEQGEIAKHQSELEKAIAKEPTDADVLIALYRLPSQSVERAANTKKLIDQATEGFREEIHEWRTNLDRAGNQNEEEVYGRLLSTAYNQYAWLVGNTTGDYQEALQYSLRSLELRPGEAGHLDTLGRCYYSVGDLKNAIKSQQEACRIDPHAGQLRRQLEFFQKELAKQESASEPARP